MQLWNVTVEMQFSNANTIGDANANADVNPEADADAKANADAIAKSKRFSKKSQAALQKMIPDMVASIMQKKHESTGRFTYDTVQRAVYRYCDNYYFNNDVLIESSRWGRLAGLGEDR